MIELQPHEDPEKTYYVLLHLDQSHVYAFPNGKAYYTESKNAAELYEKILQKDMKCRNYAVCELREALTRIGNKQAELEQIWASTLDEIQRTKLISERRAIYRRAHRKFRVPHPVSYDAFLKKLLNLTN